MELPASRFVSRLRLLLLIALVGGVVPFVAPGKAVSLPFNFDVVLTVGTASCVLAPAMPCFSPPVGPRNFTRLPAWGEVFNGTFTIEDPNCFDLKFCEVLKTRGKNLPDKHPYTLTRFQLKIEDLVWDAFNPSFANNVFSGFRGPIFGDPFCPGGNAQVCLFAPSPGFDVENNNITGIAGGVFGPGDVPFVDFAYLAGEGNFGASDGYVFIPGTVLIRFTPENKGIPEPASLVLLGCGLVGLAGMASWRKRRAVGASRTFKGQRAPQTP